METWTKDLPKVGVEESKIRKVKVGLYGNYTLRDKIMELLSWIRDPLNVVVIKGGDINYFKQKEKELINLLTEMERLI